MKFTKKITTALWAAVITTFALTSCIKEESVPNKERERISLEAW